VTGPAGPLPRGRSFAHSPPPVSAPLSAVDRGGPETPHNTDRPPRSGSPLGHVSAAPLAYLLGMPWPDPPALGPRFRLVRAAMIEVQA
jgi:hypothetical protein